jgi:O-antigen/teichoic acid export membrane protein
VGDGGPRRFGRLRLSARLRSFLHDSAWLLLAKLVTAGATLAVGAILARLLAPADLAVYLLALGLSLALGHIAALGVNLSGMRFIAEAMARGDEASARSTISAALAAGTGGSLLVVAAIAVFPGPWLASVLADRPVDGASLLAIGLWTATLAFRMILWGAFRGLSQTAIGAWFEGAIGMSLTALIFASLWLAGSSVSLPSALWISAAAGGCTALGGWLLLASRTGFLGEGAIGPKVRPLVRVGLPIMLAHFLIVATPQAGLWALTIVRPLDEVADFGVALRLMLAASIVFMLSNQALGPLMAGMLARSETRELERFIRRTTTALLGVCGLVALPLLVFPDILIGLVFGPAYLGAVAAFVVLTLAQLAQVAFGPAQILLQMADRERGQMGLSILALAVNLLLAVPLSHLLGPVGAALATGGAIVLRAAGAAFVAYRSLGLVTLPTLRLR